MVDLIDFTFIIIALAVIGFILRDAFFFYRKYTIPYELQSEQDRMFSYISLAIFILSILWWGILQILRVSPSSIDTTLRPFLEGLQKMVEFGLLSPEQLNSYLASTLLFLYIFSAFSLIFIFLYVTSMMFGIISVYVDTRAIEIEYRDNSLPPRPFKRIIHESDEFIYVESSENFREWESIRKEEIRRIRNIFTPSPLGNFLNIHLTPRLRRIPVINNRRYVMILFVAIMIIYTLIAIYSTLIPSTFVRILSLLVFIPAIILLIIQYILDIGDKRRGREEQTGDN